MDSALIRIFVFGFSGFSSAPFSSLLPTVLALCDCWSTLVSGGLGGAWLLLSTRSFVFPLLPSLPPSVRSVGSGVGMLGLPTTSLLWALENVGYGRLVLDSRNEAVPERLALSTPGMEDRRCLRELEVDVEGVEARPVGASGSRSLVEVREVCPWDERFLRGLDLDERVEDEEVFLSRSLSRSRSFSLSGRNIMWKKVERFRKEVKGRVEDGNRALSFFLSTPCFLLSSPLSDRLIFSSSYLVSKKK